MRSPGRYSSATNRYGPDPMGSVPGRFGGVSASRRGIIIGTIAPGFAKASSTKPKGSRSCSWNCRASIASSVLVAPINSPPKASRLPEGRRVGVQSSDVTALPSWKESPSRKAKVQVMPSVLRSQRSIICGLGSQRSFTAKSVSKTRYEKSRVVKLVVKCGSKMLVSVSGATRRVSRRSADWALLANASTTGAVRPARKLRRSIMWCLRAEPLGYRCPHREDSRRSHTEKEREVMPTLPSGDIYFETHGAGTPVMLVPGLGRVGSYWNPNIPAFAQKYQVVLHDHRGTGQSSRSRIHYTVDQMTDDLMAVMNHLEIEKAHLVGHSTGGAIGQTLAAKHPERLISLVIYASWTKADPFFRRVFEARRALLTASGAAAYVRSTAI